MTPQLQKKVEFAIKLLKQSEIAAKKFDQPVEIAYSCGKDSDVILELAKMAKINYKAIYRNTTIDPPYSRKHALEHGVEIRMPKKSFFQLMKYGGLPTRYYRICCRELKEFKILDVCVMGIRKEESSKRSQRYNEPTECRFYGGPHGSKKNHVEAFYPILEWTSDDVRDFLEYRNVKAHPLYYDEDGTFHAERRLGCLCCPLKSRGKRIQQFKEYPNMVKAYCHWGNQFFEKKGNKIKFKTFYEQFTMDLFCDSIDEFQQRFGKNLFNDGIDCKQFLENYFNIKL